MSKFVEYKIGDRVRTHNENNIGTIIDFDTAYVALIEYDEFINGHDGCGMGKQGHCWWVDTTDLKLVKRVTIDQHEMEKFL